ncbi:hypothetical protein Tco_0270464 [Tanacetum coccineum]
MIVKLFCDIHQETKATVHTRDNRRERAKQCAHCFYAVLMNVSLTPDTLFEAALTWWIMVRIRTLGIGEIQETSNRVMEPEGPRERFPTIHLTFPELTLYVPRPKTLDETIELASNLMDQKTPHIRGKADWTNIKEWLMINPNNMDINKLQEAECRQGVLAPQNVSNTQKAMVINPKEMVAFECGAPGHFIRDVPKFDE